MCYQISHGLESIIKNDSPIPNPMVSYTKIPLAIPIKDPYPPPTPNPFPVHRRKTYCPKSSQKIRYSLSLTIAIFLTKIRFFTKNKPGLSKTRNSQQKYAFPSRTRTPPPPPHTPPRPKSLYIIAKLGQNSSKNSLFAIPHKIRYLTKIRYSPK